MSYWSVGVSQGTVDTQGDMEEPEGPSLGSDDMGAKASLAGGPGGGLFSSSSSSPSLCVSPTLENIQEAYESGQAGGALELLRQACCVECTSGMPTTQGVRLLCVATQHGDEAGVRYLLKEAGVAMPQHPSEQNPAILAAHYGHAAVAKALLDSVPGPCLRADLLNWMLATACRQGHLEVVRLLVQGYHADAGNCGIHQDEFAVITGLPLYAAAQAANEDIASFLLQSGAGFSSYTLMDHPVFSKQILRKRLKEGSDAQGNEVLSVCWSGLGLPWLELDWFMDLSCRLTHMDLSSNALSALPSMVPWGLVHLQTLDLSNNLLRELPATHSSQEVICTNLRELNLSQNQLSALPSGLLHLGRLQSLCTAKNQLTALFHIPTDTNWIGLRTLRDLDVSDNALCSLPPAVMPCLKSLSSLNVSRNRLGCFPDPWACPLKRCKASTNAIEVLPDTISMSWKAQLQEVDFTDNRLKELPPYIFELEALVYLRLAGNQIPTLPAPNKWKCSKLRTLDLSRNQLGKTEEGTKSWRRGFLTTWSRRDPDPACPIEFPAFLRDSLEVLFLNDNHLECVPPSLCGLLNLNELYLTNNPLIRELPAELGQLANLWQLDVEGLNITNVPQEVRKEGTASVLAYLRAHLRKAEPCKLLKMLLVGPPRQGKTALLEALNVGRTSPLSTTDCSISTSTWELDRPSGCRNAKDSILFNVWDLGGPASMSTVNQCFFTDKALYVVLWNLVMGEEAVASLRTWLLNIEARAPNSAVVVVGTHLDLIDSRFRTERVATLRAYILALCRSPSGARATGYPDVTMKQLHEVSCKTQEGMEVLRSLLYQVACSMKDHSTSASRGQRLVGRLIPRSYLTLQEAVLDESIRRDSEDEVQYLTAAQLDRVVERNPESDIRDYEDLQSAIRFLIETGTLLHFPDTSHGLCTLYFLCPVWLSECLERIIHLKSSRSVARNGLISAEDLRMLLVGTGFTEQTEEQYFQFLSKFEIALPVASNSYLLPHLLPAKPSMDIHGLRQETTNTLQRLFKMSFVPAGFWERFIARMLISLAEMDLHAERQQHLKSFQSKQWGLKGACSRNSVVYSFARAQMKNRCSTFRVRRNQTIYWKEGLLVTFKGGYLSVESSDVNWKRKKSGGIQIICQSDTRDFSAMAFITDHVNSLIEQWFPALTASESDGSALIEQYAPCPLCASLGKADHSDLPAREPPPRRPGAPEGAASGAVHYFSMEECVLAAMEGQRIACPQHPEQQVALQELVPELFMTDFPSRLFLDKEQLECHEEEENVLGQGGSGTVVYRASYCGQPIAVKHFHFKKCRQAIRSDRDTMLRHLQSVDACRSFSEFRQEASMLHSLQHPCVVALVGISIHPLCFALQLAPLGSLNTVLEEGCRDKGSGYMPLGHMLTFRIAYQIATGLAYLHRKNIIFCDLKSDNILVWSLEVTDPVNVKLSDYGISRQSFHEGALGVEGTPGYQAPEIRPGIVYDEKVDMFSYGMVLYELLSGCRPALGQHQLQIAKKLSKGIRPALGGPVEVQFQCLQGLMSQCWDTKPEKRPPAQKCVRQMQDPSFPCLRYLLSCDSQAQLFLSPLQGPSAIFWDGDKDDRKYSVVNLEKGQVEERGMANPGSTLSCQMKMDNTLWVATKEQEVFIYSLREMCPLSQPQKSFSCPAVVTCLLPAPARDQSPARVFAGMADGLLAVYSMAGDVPQKGEAYLCSHTINKTQFGIGDTDPRQRPYPIKCMVLVNRDAQLWVSHGPGLLVLDCLTLRAVRRLEPYAAPSCVEALALDLSLWGGDEALWTLDDHTNTLLLYHAASYQLCAKYSCGDCSPMRDTFSVQRPGGAAGSLAPSDPGDVDPGGGGGGGGTGTPGVALLYSEEAGTQIVSLRRSLPDYCFLPPRSDKPPLTMDRWPGPGAPGLSVSPGPLAPGAPGRSVSPGPGVPGVPGVPVALVAPVAPSRSVSPGPLAPGAPGRSVSPACGPPAADWEETSDDLDQLELSSASSETDHTPDPEPDPTPEPTPDHLRALTVLAVNGTVWIPRRGGDVMVIEVQAQADLLQGRVIAVLAPPGLSSLGVLEAAALVARDTVVCGYRGAGGRWGLAVWRAWGRSQLQLFHRSYEELGRLEASVRRR